MKALLIIFTSLLLFGCIEEGTIVYDQDYPEAPENIGGSGSGADRAPGDGAGSAGGTSDGSGSTGGSSDGSGVDGGATSTGSDGSTTGGDGSGDGSTGGSTGESTSGGTGTDGGSGSGNAGGDTGSSSTGGDTSTGSDGGETGSGSSDGSGSTGGSTDGGSGDGSTGGSADGSGSDGSGSTGSTGGTDGGTTDGSGSGSTGGSTDGSSTDGAGSTGDGAGTDGGDGSSGDGSDGGSGTGDGSGSGDGGTGDGAGIGEGTSIDAPTVTLTAKEQKIVVTWSPVDNATSYNLTWVSSDGTENIIDVSAQQVADGADPIVFAHAPLVAGQNYTYTVTAVAADGTEAVGTPLTGSALPLGCTPSTYSPEGLVAYYSFEGDLSDSAGSYDLTPTGDSIAYSNGCVNGKAGHFDGDGGYAYNLDFNDENVDEVADGRWSISVWVNADEDMNKWSSVFSTTAVKDEFDTGADSWGEGFQLNVTDNMRPQLYGCREDHCDGSQKLTAPNALELNTWTHLAVTMDNGTANLYVNGENVGTYEGMITEFNRLKVGLNRRGQESWKGYIDELMVFGETLSADEVMSIYNNTLPGTPQNATATNWVGD
ncbi:MAG: LamG domain-containing protein, partial [bacterium]